MADEAQTNIDLPVLPTSFQGGEILPTSTGPRAMLGVLTPLSDVTYFCSSDELEELYTLVRRMRKDLGRAARQFQVVTKRLIVPGEDE